MPAAWNAALLADVGQLLRRLHQLPGERFGSLLPSGPSWETAWQWVDALSDDLVHKDLEADGPAALGVRVRRLVDLERASWGDPLYDLAKTRVHVAHHDPTGVDVLTRAYGVAGEEEQRGIEVYEVIHALAERTWITLDRPQGWARSVAALEAYVGQRT